jgi:hypothetical protein
VINKRRYDKTPSGLSAGLHFYRKKQDVTLRRRSIGVAVVVVATAALVASWTMKKDRVRLEGLQNHVANS